MALFFDADGGSTYNVLCSQQRYRQPVTFVAIVSGELWKTRRSVLGTVSLFAQRSSRDEDPLSESNVLSVTLICTRLQSVSGFHAPVRLVLHGSAGSSIGTVSSSLLQPPCMFSLRQVVVGLSRQVRNRAPSETTSRGRVSFSTLTGGPWDASKGHWVPNVVLALMYCGIFLFRCPLASVLSS